MRQSILNVINLITHQTLHTGEKKLQFVHFDKAFAVNCMLITHQEVHIGMKEFKCDRCSKAFAPTGSFIYKRCILA